MVRPLLLAATALLVLSGGTAAQSTMTFINPPPQGSETNPANFPKFQTGSTVTVRWTKNTAGKAMSLTLWQLDQKTMQFFGDMEYLSQNFIDKDSYSWLVATRKNLTLSNLFYFAIFQEGSSRSDSNSQYFNITSPQATSSASTPKTTTSATTGSAAATTTSGQPSQTGAAGSTNGDGDSANSSGGGSSSDGGLSTGAKVGIGVGVPLVVLAAAAAGFLLWRRQRRARDGAAAQPMLGGEDGGAAHYAATPSQYPGSPSAMTSTTAASPAQPMAAAAAHGDAAKLMLGGHYGPPPEPVEMSAAPPVREMSAAVEHPRPIYEMPTPDVAGR